MGAFWQTPAYAAKTAQTAQVVGAADTLLDDPAVGVTGASPVSEALAATPSATRITTVGQNCLNTYGIAFPAGASETSGGTITAGPSNVGTIYVDPTGATGTQLSGGQTALSAGETFCWPAITTAVTIMGTAATDQLSGSAC